MDDKRKKQFVIPKAEIIDFKENDIITGSGDSNWNNDDNWEDFGGGNN